MVQNEACDSMKSRQLHNFPKHNYWLKISLESSIRRKETWCLFIRSCNSIHMSTMHGCKNYSILSLHQSSAYLPFIPYSAMFAVAWDFSIKLNSWKTWTSCSVCRDKHDGVVYLAKSHPGNKTTAFSTQILLGIFVARPVLTDVPVLLLVLLLNYPINTKMVSREVHKK